MTGISRSMRVSLDCQRESLHTRRERSIKMATYRLPRIESDDPEDVSLWLGKFEENLKEIGKGYEYPMSKFNRSREINSSQGYRKTVFMHRNNKSFSQYKQLLTGKTVSLNQPRPHEVRYSFF